MAVSFSGNAFFFINLVAVRRARLVLACLYHLSVESSHSGQLSLAIPVCIVAIATATARGENGEFFVTLDSVIKTAGIVT